MAKDKEENREERGKDTPPPAPTVKEKRRQRNLVHSGGPDHAECTSLVRCNKVSHLKIRAPLSATSGRRPLEECSWHLLSGKTELTPGGDQEGGRQKRSYLGHRPLEGKVLNLDSLASEGEVSKTMDLCSELKITLFSQINISREKPSFKWTRRMTSLI